MPVTTPTVWLAPFIVNSTDAGPDGNDQTSSQVIALTGGRFFVAWADNGNANILGAPDVFGRFVDPVGAFNGGPAGGNDFIMNSFVDFSQGPPAIAARPDGGLNLAYQTMTDPIFGLGEGVPIDRFDANGLAVLNPKPGPSWINQAEDETAPAIAAFSNGASVVVFSDNAAGNQDVRFRIVDSTGLIGAEFDAAAGAGNQTAADVAVLSGTSFVTVVVTDSAGNADISFAILQTDGTPLASAGIASGAAAQTDPSVAALTGGGFVVTWTDAAADGSGSAVMARIFTSAGLPLPAAPAAFLVPAATAGDQKSPCVIALSDGGFVIFWDDDGSLAIKGQRFGASGAPLGTGFTASAMADVSDPDAALLGDGRFVVSFSSESGGNSDIYAAIFDPREPLINGTLADDVITSRMDGGAVNGLGGSDTLLGQAGNDALNGGAGADMMRGGLGNDNYYVDNIGDSTDETGGGGIGDYVLTTVSFTAAAGIERIYLQGAANINAIGRDGQVDFLLGNSGNNALDGKSGIDTMRGGLGNDNYYVDNIADVTDETTGGGGIGDYVLTTVSFTAAAGIERIYLQGSANINATGRDAQVDFLLGNSGNNALDGKGGIDTMRGGLGNDNYYVDNVADVTDEVTGGGGIGDYVLTTVSFTSAAGIERIYLQGAGNINATGRDGQVDYLIGNAGNNILNGKGGNDDLQGNAGQDTYRFDTAPNAATNQDQIIGFVSAVDKIEIDNAVFTALGLATGPLAASMFQIGAAANDIFDRIIYNNATGALLYDADGSGGGAAIKFASLTGAPVLALGDLFVI